MARYAKTDKFTASYRRGANTDPDVYGNYGSPNVIKRIPSKNSYFNNYEGVPSNMPSTSRPGLTFRVYIMNQGSERSIKMVLKMGELFPY